MKTNAKRVWILFSLSLLCHPLLGEGHRPVDVQPSPTTKAPSHAPAATSYRWGDDLVFSILNSDDKHPFITTFPESMGVNSKGKDESVASAIGIIKSARGASTLYPKEDAGKGLIVVFRTLAFLFEKNKETGEEGYSAVLAGEFKAVKVPVSSETMKSLFAGKRTEIRLKSKYNYRVITAEPDTKIVARLAGDSLAIDQITGDCTLGQVAFNLSGWENYKSKSISLNKARGSSFLYKGVQADKAALDAMPILPGASE